MKTALIIGSVWPEPNSSAAGHRMLQIIALLQDLNYQIIFASHANLSENSIDFQEYNIKQIQIKLNSSSFDETLKDLAPELVMFDRFMTEEQYSWRVDENCPNAIKTLDTEDLHCLRYGREFALKNKSEFTEMDLLNTEHSIREIAAIMRCDLSLIISEYEIDLLHRVFAVPPHIIFYLPFLLKTISSPNKQFEQRRDFMSIGNFLHKPNWDAVRYLKEEIWPLIRKQLPDANMKIYGAYTPQKALQLHNESEGFLVLGKAEDSKEVMSDARLCLAPLRFGAGLKGKLLEAMQCGTPSITTSIGAEGMHGDLEWPGHISNSPEEFAQAAIEIYSTQELWEKHQQQCPKILSKRFLFSEHQDAFNNVIHTLNDNLSKHRSENFMGKVLNYNSNRSSKFMSLWIEAKNQSKTKT
ncbi:glycosyltransferase [Lentisphaera profundi]|uniref:Glycosyltransferase n=1 Tax=Lentisphaera profundi TaxID=1658616 RepID=A0ABY7VRC3_9BACT|nr:glycosyltransferase [Lentisphaera profundi]WDE96741.1 glycosyltransferase [Lentisphaera profundi]